MWHIISLSPSATEEYGLYKLKDVSTCGRMSHGAEVPSFLHSKSCRTCHADLFVPRAPAQLGMQAGMVGHQPTGTDPYLWLGFTAHSRCRHFACCKRKSREDWEVAPVDNSLLSSWTTRWRSYAVQSTHRTGARSASCVARFQLS